ncbi:hypothetical protein L0F63_000409, partial [Massospora cicadina]
IERNRLKSKAEELLISKTKNFPQNAKTVILTNQAPHKQLDDLAAMPKGKIYHLDAIN